MPQAFNRREIGIITRDLETYLHSVNASSNKIDYFKTVNAELENTGHVIMQYENEPVNIIPEIENTVLGQLEEAEQKMISFQFHFALASVVVQIDKMFFNQVFFRLLYMLMDHAKKNQPGASVTQSPKSMIRSPCSVIQIYVTDCDGKCSIEAITRTNNEPVAQDDYFKKYRITNVPKSVQDDNESLLRVFKQLISGMGGELNYDFGKNKSNYCRIVFALAGTIQ